MPAVAARTGHPARLIAIEEFFADPVFAGASISPTARKSPIWRRRTAV
jgi:hypothetical protein